MAQDTEHEQALQDRADSLVTEQHALHKRLQQLQQELGLEADAAQQLAVGEHSSSWSLEDRTATQLNVMYRLCWYPTADTTKCNTGQINRPHQVSPGPTYTMAMTMCAYLGHCTSVRPLHLT